jgi:MFS family permease
VASRTAAGDRTQPVWLGLPRPVRLLLLADLITAFGIGLTQPFLVVLLNGVRSVPLVTATAMVSLMPLASVPGNGISGWLVDRTGGHRAMTAGLSLSALGFILTAVVHGPWWLGVTLVGTGLGLAVSEPAFASLLAVGVGEAASGRAFTIKYALFNMGLAGGAAAGAVVVRGGVTGRLLPLWWVAALTCGLALLAVRAARTRTVPAPALAQGPAPGTTPQTSDPQTSDPQTSDPQTSDPQTSDPQTSDPETSDLETSGRGYRAVFGDAGMRRVLLAAVLASTAGYGVYYGGLPALAIVDRHESVLSWVNVVNCLTVAAGLPLALRVGAALRPPRLLALTAAAWSLAWLLCIGSALFFAGTTGVTMPVAAAVFGIGELFLSGALVSLVNARAPEALRGRYNATLALAITTGLWLGPLLAAGAVAAGRLWLLFAVAIGLLASMVRIIHSPIAEVPRVAVPS